MRYFALIVFTLFIACTTDKEDLPPSVPPCYIGSNLVKTMTYATRDYDHYLTVEGAFAYKEHFELAYNDQNLVKSIKSTKNLKAITALIGNEVVEIEGIKNQIETKNISYNAKKQISKIVIEGVNPRTLYFTYSNDRLISISEETKTTYISYNEKNQVSELAVKYNTTQPDNKSSVQKLLFDEKNNLIQLDYKSEDGFREVTFYYSYNELFNPYINTSVNLQLYHPLGRTLPSLRVVYIDLHYNFEYFDIGQNAISVIGWDKSASLTQFDDYKIDSNSKKIKSAFKQDINNFHTYNINYTYY